MQTRVQERRRGLLKQRGPRGNGARRREDELASERVERSGDGHDDALRGEWSLSVRAIPSFFQGSQNERLRVRGRKSWPVVGLKIDVRRERKERRRAIDARLREPALR